ncbi:hemicentin-1-like [Amphiura filiformis]|uniref:hemicentin-1-like n=1 Tax=Amphiura filiformis TaxID=82378 RepID=UPI003B20E57B
MAWFNIVATIFCLLVIGTILTSAQTFTTQPVETDARRNENTQLSCGVSGLNNNQYVSWFKGPQELTNNDAVTAPGGSLQIKVQTSASETLFTLTLLNVTDADGGAYGCKIRSVIDSSFNDSRFVTVDVIYFPPAIYPICDPASSFTIVDGSTTTVTCQSELGVPQVDIAWERADQRGRILQSDPLTNLPAGFIGVSHSLTADRSRNGTEYICSISNLAKFPNVMSSCSSGPLNVLYPPDNVAVSLTTSQTYSAFRCSASANPGATYSWTFNTPISASLHNIIENNQVLVLLDSIICDEIDIIATCTASNSQGEFTASVTLCQVPTCTPPDIPDSMERESQILSCQIPGPVDSVEWTRTYVATNKMEQLAMTQTETMLDYDLFVNRTYANTRYVCRATNNDPPWIGVCQSGPLVNVYFPPNDIAITPTVFGEKSAFRCSATGFPENITFTWTINPDLGDTLYDITDNGQLLVINDIITCSDTDIMATCEASNTLATYAINTTLCQVPTCSPPDTSFDKTEGETVALSCEVCGPSESLSWTRVNLISNSTDALVSTSTETILQYDMKVNRNHAQTEYLCTAISETPPWLGWCESGPLMNVLFPPNDFTITQTTHDTYTAFRCSATGYPSPTFAWTVPTAVDISKYSIMESGQLLVVMDTIICDMTDIVAICEVQNSVDLYRANVTLCKVPTCTPSEEFEYREGEHARLSCQVDQAVETLAWTRTNENSNDSVELASSVNSAFLNYEWAVDRNHTQTSYECRISNAAPPWTGLCQSGSLNVPFPPDDISIYAELIDDGTGQYESYLCSANGNPSDIMYAWTIAPPLDVSSYEISDDDQRLIITRNIVCDTDIIATCKSSNSIGTYVADIALCKAPICTPPDKWIMTEGVNATLLCQHNVSPVDITWNQNGSLATASNAKELSYTFPTDRVNTDEIYTCTISTNAQPTYEGVCTAGPLIVQYPPEQLAILPSEYELKNETLPSFICSADGMPQVSYSWKFTSAFTQGLHYSIEDDGTRLVILDVALCETNDFMTIATCLASNALDTASLGIMICDGKPYTTKSKGGMGKSAAGFEFTHLWIIVIALCSFMILVIIIALIICAVRRSPLISVDVENRKPKEEKTYAKPIKLSLAPSEVSFDDNSNPKSMDQLPPAKLALANSNNSADDVDDEDDTDQKLFLADIQEVDEPKDAHLVGVDNPAYTSFKTNGDAHSPAKTNKPDLLTYMTRPVSQDADITLANVPAEESNMPNGSAGKSDPADESNNISDNSTNVDESVLPYEEDETEMETNNTESSVPVQTPEESSMNNDPSTKESSNIDSNTGSPDVKSDPEISNTGSDGTTPMEL